jgi:hypothetical protein
LNPKLKADEMVARNENTKGHPANLVSSKLSAYASDVVMIRTVAGITQSTPSPHPISRPPISSILTP